MKHFFIYMTFGCCLMLSVNVNNCWASTRPTNLQEQLAFALKYKMASNTDTAAVILQNIIRELEGKGEMNTHLGLSARLHLADILVTEQNDFSSQELLQLVEIGTKQRDWEVVAHAHIILELVHELIQNQEKCDYHLDQAFKLIEEHQLRELYPYYSVRRSSYFRVFLIDQDSSLYYAKEALRHATPYPSRSKADTYLLLTALNDDFSTKVEYAKKSMELSKELGNYIGQASMAENISRLFLNDAQLDSAMWYNAFAEDILNEISRGHLDSFRLSVNIYKDRADIYKALGQMDSAWHYINLSYENNRFHNWQENIKVKTVTEVEGRYKEEKQAQQIKLEQARKQGAIILFLSALTFAVILAYLYIHLRKANQKNKAQAERLAQLDQAKSRFFANVSHELRTPLTLILGPIHTLLKEDQLISKHRKLLMMADKSGQQLQELINEILNLRKLELNKIEVEAKATQLHPFFYRYFAQFESLAVRKEIDFAFEIALPEKQVGKIDREKCRQILYNLLSNAFKFTPKNGQIKAKVTLKNGTLQLTVSDTGEGIHPEDLPNVFERYFQTNRSEKSIEGGTGIGLALCYEYVQLFGGNIDAKSKLGKGTTFNLSFPIHLLDAAAITTDLEANQRAAATTLKAETISIINSKQPHILVVEDNPALADYLQLILSPHYRIATAENGQQALDYLASNANNAQASNCQLILSDLMMPVMDGYQLLEKLKAHDTTRHIPVVMLTARSDMRDKLKALRLGVDDYLLKPFDEEELLTRIESLLHNQAVRQTAKAMEQTETKITTPIISEKEQVWVKDFETFIRKNLGNTRLSVPMLAEEFIMSESTLLRQLKRLVGLTPKQYFKEMRLEKARQLIEEQTYDSISQVAYEVGYSDPKSFSRAFKVRFGKLPSTVSTN